jgi:hypothetical protein
MARYGMKTNKSAQEIIDRAVDFFGKNGEGLEIIDRGACCATFEGGGGHVSLTVTEGDKTEVELVTREWDYQAKQFMRQIA